MARTKDPAAAKEFGRNLMRQWKRHRPAMSELEHALRARGLVIDRETLRLYHASERDPAHIDIAIAVALSNYYEVDVGELHPSFTPRAELTGAILAGFSSPSDQGSPSSAWVTAAELTEAA